CDFTCLVSGHYMVCPRCLLHHHAKQHSACRTDSTLVDFPSLDRWQHLSGVADRSEYVARPDAAPLHLEASMRPNPNGLGWHRLLPLRRVHNPSLLCQQYCDCMPRRRGRRICWIVRSRGCGEGVQFVHQPGGYGARSSSRFGQSDSPAQFVHDLKPPSIGVFADLSPQLRLTLRLVHEMVVAQDSIENVIKTGTCNSSTDRARHEVPRERDVSRSERKRGK